MIHHTQQTFTCMAHGNNRINHRPNNIYIYIISNQLSRSRYHTLVLLLAWQPIESVIVNNIISNQHIKQKMVASSSLVSLYKYLLVGTFLFSDSAFAFLPQASLDRTASIVLSSSSSSSSNENNQVGRRDALQFVATTAALGLNLALTTTTVHADDSTSTTSKVVVAGATGQVRSMLREYFVCVTQ